MGVVSEVKGDGIKIPFFDTPTSAVVRTQPIACGSRVVLFCEGIQIQAQVMVFGGPGTMSVGRVVGFTPCTTHPNGLNAGDFVRFRPEDVHRVEQTGSPPPPVPPLVQALRDVREMLYRARRKRGGVREIEAAIERINYELDRKD